MKTNQVNRAKKEIKRLSKMASMGGSGAYIAFYKEAEAIVKKYNVPGPVPGVSPLANF